MHVEPGADEAALRERAHAAALSVPRVREIHNLSVVSLDGATELSLHLKLPGDLPLEEAHEIAEEVERAIVRCRPRDRARSRPTSSRSRRPSARRGRRGGGDSRPRSRARPGGPPRELRLLRTEKGVVAFLTLGLDPDSTLAEAHARASEVEERLRRARPDVADVIVHTEP